MADSISTKQPLLGFTPYNATNPSGYITSSSLTPYALSSKVQGDSITLATAINSKGSGTLTSITLGSGLSGSSNPLTTSGAIGLDSSSSIFLSRQRAEATYATKSKVIADSIALAAHADADTVNLRPRLVAGTNITIAGTYPNLTIGSSGGSSLNNGQVGVGNGSNALSGSSALTFSSQVLNNFDTLPELRLTTAQDSFYSRIQRNYTNHTTYLKAQAIQQGGYSNALSFTNGSSYFNAPTTGLPSGTVGSTLPSFSISMWVNIPSSNVQNGIILVGWGTNSSGGNCIALEYSKYYGNVNFNIGYGYSGGISKPLTQGVWHNLIVTYNSSTSTTTLYCDGIGAPSAFTTIYTIDLGGYLTNYMLGYFPNYIGQQLLIYNTTLNTTQIGQIYNAGGPTSSLIASSNIIREYNFNLNNSPSANQSPESINSTYFATLYSSPTLVSGIVPTSSTITEGTPIQYQDGVNAGEMGTLYLGDPNSGTYLRGLSIKSQIGSYNPFMIGANRKCYINSSNTSLTSVPLSDLSIAGGAAIGATYSTGTAAPTNGLIVQGTTGLGTATPSSSYILDAVGNARITGTSTVTSTSTATTFNSSIAPTAITGAGGSGTAYFSEPIQGTATNGGYKKIMIYLNAFVSSGGTTITYSSSGGIAFTNTPYVTGTSSCVSAVGTPSATAITISTASALTGYIFLEGN